MVLRSYSPSFFSPKAGLAGDETREPQSNQLPALRADIAKRILA